MTIDFHHPDNRLAYATRAAHADWKRGVVSLADFAGARVADIGCGGGIYTMACLELGAASVTAVDFSAEMLKGAELNCRGAAGVEFRQGDALATGLEGGVYSIVLERALIHHLPRERLHDCFAEAYRLLAPGGVFIVQDRTPEDCLLPGSGHHLRGYFFEKFPRLARSETARRHSSAAVIESMKAAGFTDVRSTELWETRKQYANREQLRDDLLARTGRSLLHELSDEELHTLCNYVEERANWPEREPIEERDRWTVWTAQKR